MLFAIDIGNTNIVVGAFKGKRLIKRSRIPTGLKPPELTSQLKKIIKAQEATIISSVVPQQSKVIADILKKHFKIKPLLLGKDIKVPIRNLYRKPKQVGQDRLVNAYACLKLYGAPAIIVDFGTATTFDYLDKKGAYSGGLITPGVEVTIEALASRTALLPKIKLKRPKRLIGKDTVESMRSGILYGLASMCDGVIKKIKTTHSPRATVVATGGLATFFAPYCKQIDRIDKDLTLIGLYLISIDI